MINFLPHSDGRMHHVHCYVFRRPLTGEHRPCNCSATPGNLISHKPSLSDIVMPLIAMLAQSGLSWAQRAEISSAIGACERHWKDMEDERQYLNQQNCTQQQKRNPA